MATGAMSSRSGRVRAIFLAVLPLHASATFTVNWLTSPVPHGGIVMANGGGWGSDATHTSLNVVLTDGNGSRSVLPVLDITPSGVKFELPPRPSGAASDFAAYDVEVCRVGDPATCSAPVALNTPDVWWWQVGSLDQRCSTPPHGASILLSAHSG